MNNAYQNKKDTATYGNPAALIDIDLEQYNDLLKDINSEHRQLIENIDNNKPAVIIAGHYCLAEHMQELSSHGKAESMCFELGIQLFVRALKKNIQHHLVVWVNDIGIRRDHRETIKNNFILPENYRSILNKYGLNASHISVMFESSMRNKASTLVKKILKRQPGRLKKVNANNPSLVRCVTNSSCDMTANTKNNAYIIKGPNQEQLVIKEGPAPKCNLILATFFSELVKQFSPKHFINIFNEVYAYRLRLGVHVAYSLLNNSVAMTNVLCDGELIKCEFFDNLIAHKSMSYPPQPEPGALS